VAILAAIISLVVSLAFCLASNGRMSLISWSRPSIWVNADLSAPPLWPILASAILIVAGAVDAVCMIIPDAVVLPGLVGSLLLASLDGEFGSAMLGGVVGFAVFALLFCLRPGALGMGDVKLAGLIGMAVRLNGLPVALMAGMLTGGVYGVILLLTRRARWKDAVPYGPSLAFGGIVGLWCVATGAGG
jgi:leader peptidase (prepilin peptidase)/N-methyltransferase